MTKEARWWFTVLTVMKSKKKLPSAIADAENVTLLTDSTEKNCWRRILARWKLFISGWGCWVVTVCARTLFCSVHVFKLPHKWKMPVTNPIIHSTIVINDSWIYSCVIKQWGTADMAANWRRLCELRYPSFYALWSICGRRLKDKSVQNRSAHSRWTN